MKEKVGEICPTVFTSDMAESFFNAWSNTFQSKPKHRLFYTWHVDRAWRKNLQKIQSREVQLEVYKTLRTLMEEKDVDACNVMFSEVLTKILENDLTREFCKYFVENYANCINSWVYCHHLQSSLNINMHFERMHKTLKYIYLKGRNAKRLDKTIYALMRDKLVDRLIVMNKGKLTSKLKDLRQRHKTILSLSTVMIIENESGYIVPLSSSHGTYLVQQNNTNCSCKLIYTDCSNTCIRNYSCTCLDANVKWNMCKHIHLVCRHKFTVVQAESSNTNNFSSLHKVTFSLMKKMKPEPEKLTLLITELCEKENEKSLTPYNRRWRQESVSWVQPFMPYLQCELQTLVNSSLSKSGHLLRTGEGEQS
ncbi:MULE domain-containing protein [Trichonephila inaurata madagascariensis]|uniref:MULE domain-containing protein n=1 Tax=Trichonephila inaurata madagascariensis TaxID=2747483 RepID=A0A8X7C614_9ARAC|nr:MULE domain-containing protein [Trichonephila inaurata madagascariensis]